MLNFLKKWFKGEDAPVGMDIGQEPKTATLEVEVKVKPVIPIQEGGGNFTPGEIDMSCLRSKPRGRPKEESPQHLQRVKDRPELAGYYYMHVLESCRAYDEKLVLEVYEMLQNGMSRQEIVEATGLNKLQIHVLAIGHAMPELYKKMGIAGTIATRSKCVSKPGPMTVKLTPPEVLKIREMHRSGMLGTEIADAIGNKVTSRNIQHIIARKTWKELD